MNHGVDNEIPYNPAIDLAGAHPLTAYTSEDGCQCNHLADLHRGLLRSVGIVGNVQYHWGGLDSDTMASYEIGSIPTSRVSMRVSAPTHDGVEANPHFTFHAVDESGGTLYDPSYGLAYTSVVILETAGVGFSGP